MNLFSNPHWKWNGRILMGFAFFFLICAGPNFADTNSSFVVEEIQITGGPKTPEIQEPKSSFGAFRDVLSNDLSLTVSLDEVVILVILISVFALFKSTKGILVTNYIFCLKWFFLSNYSALLKQSDSITTSSSVVFVICGILILALFLMGRFSKSH
jgi:hypothetical protein